MFSNTGLWLEHDAVALAALLIGRGVIGFIAFAR
jgi:hypothetical protein